MYCCYDLVKVDIFSIILNVKVNFKEFVSITNMIAGKQILNV